MPLTDDVFKSLHQLMPGLRCVQVGKLSLATSHADVDCSWQELQLHCELPLCKLLWLPLARAGRQTRGVQRLLLAGIQCVLGPEAIDADVAAVCSSSCRLAPVHVGSDEGKQPEPFTLRVGLENLARVLPLLACFESNSIHSLRLCYRRDVLQPALTALDAALATSGGMAALARCHTLTLDFISFQDDAPFAQLLPMLMATPVRTLCVKSNVSEACLAAICAPHSLAAVTRSITLQGGAWNRRLNVSVEKAEASVNAAGKAHLVRLMRT
jgi:hypothetical protein